jgi:hypothetical protein
MLNDFRTRLLNLDSDTAKDILKFGGIDPKFTPIPDPFPVSALRHLIYPVQSLEEKVLLTTVYLRLIDACLLTEYVLSYDPRITYSLNGTFDDRLNAPLKDIMKSALFWTFEHETWLHSRLKEVPERLARLYLTYSDELVKFCSLLLIVFGRFK